MIKCEKCELGVIFLGKKKESPKYKFDSLVLDLDRVNLVDLARDLLNAHAKRPGGVSLVIQVHPRKRAIHVRTRELGFRFPKAPKPKK